MFCEKKKIEVSEKKIQSVEGRKKNVSVEFRVFEKKKEIERKVRERKKNQSIFG